MSQPPRLKHILLEWDQSIVYFVTLCTEGRVAALANAEVFSAIQGTLEQMRKWRTLGGVVMPDHIHVIVTPAEDRSLPVSDFSTGFKRLLRKSLRQGWIWQTGCFDRLLRSGENLHNKWIYVEQNPVRAGLVKDVSEWPYYLGTIREQLHAISVGEAVSLPGRTGKLTASPTGAGRSGTLTASPTEKANRTGTLTASPTGKQII